MELCLRLRQYIKDYRARQSNFKGLPRAIVISSILRPSKKFLSQRIVEAIGLINLISEIPSKYSINTAGVKTLLYIHSLLRFRNQSGCTSVRESDDMEGIGIFKRDFVAMPQLEGQRLLNGKQIYYGRSVDDRS